ncbi:TonB-dependent receptor [Abyssalbus ytuae]|uniref:TonB-dependent receptor n=1 Tax=Abyssalbus ytuae TaxID=2926907 RepID=A0A9E7CT49_9FLAO|nr:TonB-dependent receptor [Abyssalbus ytuae]UOB17471.1 TonB-dependent receptor [Abyssalbus ytuae]
MKHIVTAFLLLAAVKIQAQDCNFILSGEVVDFHDQTPLSEATLIVIENNITVTTDANGHFYINNVCNGELSLQVSHPECVTRIVQVIVNGNTTLTINLEHHLEELGEVYISTKAIDEKTNSVAEETMSSERLEAYSQGTLGDALREINGVSSLNTGAHIVKPVIQGLKGSRVLLLNNGVRMQDMEWGDEHAPNIDINSVGNVTVVKGAGALRYGGDAVGGVIILEPEKIPVKDTLYGKTILSGATNGRGGAVTSTLTRSFKSGWFAKGQLSYKRFGDSETPDYILSNTGMEEKGLSFNVGKKSFYTGWNAYYSYYNANIAVLAASHIGNVDDLISSINSKEPLIIRDFTYDINHPDQEVTHHLGKIEYFKRFDGLGKWQLQYDFQYNHRNEYDRRVGDDRDKPAIDLELTTHSFTTDFTFDKNKDIKINTGLLARYQDNFANPDTGVRRLIPDYDKYDLGFYISSEYRGFKNLTLDAGLRYDYTHIDAKRFYRVSTWEERGYDEDFSDIIIEDYGSQYLTNPVFDYHSFSATAGLNYAFANTKTLRVNYSLSQRAPNPSELFSDGLHHSAARIELGDLRIQQETSHKVSLSVSKENDRWTWEVSPYVNFINNYIFLEPVGVDYTIRGSFPVYEYHQTNATLIGVDAKTGLQWNDWFNTEHGFSMIKGHGSDKNPLINMPPPVFKNKVTFYKEKWKSFTASLESIYTFRQNEYPDNIQVFSPEANEEVTLDINTPPGDYHLLNADADMTFKLTGRSNMKIGIGVNNILNTRYRDYLNRLRYFADDLGRNFMIKLKLNY